MNAHCPSTLCRSARHNHAFTFAIRAYAVQLLICHTRDHTRRSVHVCACLSNAAEPTQLPKLRKCACQQPSMQVQTRPHTSKVVKWLTSTATCDSGSHAHANEKKPTKPRTESALFCNRAQPTRTICIQCLPRRCKHSTHTTVHGMLGAWENTSAFQKLRQRQHARARARPRTHAHMCAVTVASASNHQRPNVPCKQRAPFTYLRPSACTGMAPHADTSV